MIYYYVEVNRLLHPAAYALSLSYHILTLKIVSIHISFILVKLYF